MKDTPLAHLIEQIHTISSLELERRTDLLAEQEHRHVARLIAHLAEVSLRRLHLKLGYRSLFEYCVERLGLSEGCTALRIQVCRVCRRHPMILDALAGQQISLTVAGKLAPHLTDDNRERLIADCTGMTKRAAEEYLVRLAAKPAVNSGARRCHATRPKAGSAEPCQPDLYNVRFVADKDFMNKLERVAEVSGMGDALRNLGRIFERTLDEFLEKNDPEKRQERRDQRAAAAKKARARARARANVEEPVAAKENHGTAERSRTIPAPLRDQLLIRAKHRCEYRSSEGLRCSERSRLTVDHIVPWGLGGPSVPENLRVLCAAHNRLHADRCFGAGFMNRKIESARSMSAPQRRPGGYQPDSDDAANPTGVGEPATVYRASGSRRRKSPQRPMRDRSGLLNRVRFLESTMRSPTHRWTECPGLLVGQGQC